MFYELQPQEEQTNYKEILKKVGELSNLFSDSLKPSLYYRAHENCFCKYFKAENLARHDCSADAKKGTMGIGLKTWVGSNIQKVAEFGKLREILDPLDDDALVLKVAEFRNERIQTTMNLYGIKKMIYHIVIREDNKMTINECPFDFIDINHIKRLPKKDGKNTRYFTDGKHEYNFNKSKTTLYMNFNDLTKLDEFDVSIMDDPFNAIMNVNAPAMGATKSALQGFNVPKYPQLALRLFSFKEGAPYVFEKSGLNQWNAGGRVRDENEVYIPFNKEDRERPENIGFFPSRDTPFKLDLPDGKVLSAKICQESGKAIMSNPNKELGKWLLRDILNLPTGTLLTYDILQEKGFDTVLFTKYSSDHYSIDFVASSVYDEMYNENSER